MPIQKDQEHDYEWLKKHSTDFNSNNVCGECGGALALCWGGYYKINNDILRCVNNFEHHTIARKFELTPANRPGFLLFDAGKKRREQLENKIGEQKALALRKYQGIINLDRAGAMEILETIWPGAPIADKTKAAMICVNYQLNPLMKHVFLIPFNKGQKNETWAVVMGISATRLLASRRGNFSYIDDTPRIMNEEEQTRIFGEVDTKNLVVIVKVKDPKTGAEVPGYGRWPKGVAVYGADKGNSIFNMAAIRAERQALDKLRPGEMPSNVDVMDDNLAENAAYQDGVVDSSGKVLPDEVVPELDPGDAGAETLIPPPVEEVATPTPAPAAEAKPVAKVEPPMRAPDSKITKAEADNILFLMKEANIDMTKLGEIMVKELKWKPVPSKIADLKFVQYDMLLGYLKRATGRA
ncbi:MAG: recombinase RecT [Dehalococcoidia bacterium]|jgi:hypothetical protein